MQVNLPKRLQAIASLVVPGQNAADIGTDHGYLAVYLIVNHICPQVVATDKARGPMEAARQLVDLLSLGQEIDVRLGEGVLVLRPGEVQTVCMAGMGGATIRNILSEGQSVINSCQRLVLQPMRGAPGLRKWLVANGFKIIAEEIVFEGGFYYEIMAAEKGVMTLTEDEAEFGPLLLQQKHPLLKGFLEAKKEDLLRLVEELRNSPSMDAQKRLKGLENVIGRMDKVMETL